MYGVPNSKFPCFWSQENKSCFLCRNRRVFSRFRQLVNPLKFTSKILLVKLQVNLLVTKMKLLLNKKQIHHHNAGHQLKLYHLVTLRPSQSINSTRTEKVAFLVQLHPHWDMLPNWVEETRYYTKRNGLLCGRKWSNQVMPSWRARRRREFFRFLSFKNVFPS